MKSSHVPFSPTCTYNKGAVRAQSVEKGFYTMPNAAPFTNNYTSTNGIQKIGSSSTNDGHGPIACSSVRSTEFRAAYSNT